MALRTLRLGPLNHVPKPRICLEPLVPLPCQERHQLVDDQLVDVVKDQGAALTRLHTLDSPNQLREQSLPRHGSRQKQRIKTRLVKALPHVAIGGNDASNALRRKLA